MKKNLRNERKNFVRFKVKDEKEKLVLENIKTVLKMSGRSIADGVILEKIDDENWALELGRKGNKIYAGIVGDIELRDYVRLILETPKDISVIIPICKKVRNIFEYINGLSVAKDISIVHICIDKNENFDNEELEEEEKEYKIKIIGNKFTFDFDFDKGDNTDFGLNEHFVFRMF